MTVREPVVSTAEKVPQRCIKMFKKQTKKVKTISNKYLTVKQIDPEDRNFAPKHPTTHSTSLQTNLRGHLKKANYKL